MIRSAEEFRSLRLSNDPLEYRRAAHEEASLEVWQDVITRFADMRFWVAQNKTVPVEILEVLAREHDPRVRHMVASKRKLPEHLQLLLARDPDESVRHAVSSNAKTTKQVLEILVDDPYTFVRESAKESLQKGSR